MGFLYDVKYGKILGTYNITIETVNLLKDIVSNTDWKTAQDLLQTIRSQGKIITRKLPFESSVGNMVRRVLKIVREEYASCKNKQADEVEESLHKIVTGDGPAGGDDYSSTLGGLRPAILEHIEEFRTELETSAENMAQQAREHIHANEIIMTLGKSEVVEAFLKNAAKDRKFQVFVATCGPQNCGDELAVSLAKANIATTVIPDCAIFGLMSRVNKVIVGTHTVMANGGLRAVCGSHSVALAARHYSVPVFVLAPLYQLSPRYLCSYDQDAFNSFVSPEGVLKYSDGELLELMHVYNPAFDYVPPDLVTLFISNTGGHAPSYVYRLLSELYHPEDYEL
ncbi:hypothetical protein AAG570_009219 [Ranatra chinensis]|uniref:Translation initiation factor eIF2B subunit beta n=1 Tax=Ranatra chinensis TaxID=642074 RepID=A0ABD0YVA2_9HEMI